MIVHLERLRSGQSVDLPVYDMICNSRKVETTRVLPHLFVIVEGIFVLTLPEILDCLDFKIYVETPDDLRMERRINRDGWEKLRSKASVIQKWQSNVMPMHKKMVGPDAEVADLVLSGDVDGGENVNTSLAWLQANSVVFLGNQMK